MTRLSSSRQSKTQQPHAQKLAGLSSSKSASLIAYNEEEVPEFGRRKSCSGRLDITPIKGSGQHGNWLQRQIVGLILVLGESVSEVGKIHRRFPLFTLTWKRKKPCFPVPSPKISMSRSYVRQYDARRQELFYRLGSSARFKAVN